MPLVRVRILHGKSQLAAPSRPFAANSTLQQIVSKALDPFPEYSISTLDVFPDANVNESPKTNSQFFPDFESIMLSDVATMG